MAGSFDLIQAQVGTQSVFGTGVAATAKLSGVDGLTLSPTVESILIEEMRGTLSRARSAEQVKQEGAGSIEGVLCYEDAPYYFDNLLFQDAPSGAGPYTRDWVANLASTPALRLLSLYKGIQGAAVDGYRLVGGVGNELVISGETGGPIRFAHNLIGEMVEPATMAALSDRAATWILADHATIYIDDFGTGTIGTTAITAPAWFSFELTLSANRVLIPTMQTLEPKGYHDRNMSGTLKLSLELEATVSQVYLDAILATGSGVFKKQVRLAFVSGTDELTLDFAGGSLEAPEPFTEQDGLISVDLELTEIEDTAGLGNWFVGQSVNDVSSMP